MKRLFLAIIVLLVFTIDAFAICPEIKTCYYTDSKSIVCFIDNQNTIFWIRTKEGYYNAIYLRYSCEEDIVKFYAQGGIPVMICIFTTDRWNCYEPMPKVISILTEQVQ